MRHYLAIALALGLTSPAPAADKTNSPSTAPTATPSPNSGTGAPGTATDRKADEPTGATSTPTTPKESGGLATADKSMPADAPSFVQKAAVAGMFEVQTSELARVKAQDESLKKFAEMMINDHTKANGELKELVAKGKVEGVNAVPNGLDAAHQKKLDDLRAQAGAKFDDSYKAIQLQAHKDAVALFTAQSNGGKDEDLQKFASATLPTLQKHLAEIQKLSASTTAMPRTQ